MFSPPTQPLSCFYADHSYLTSLHLGKLSFSTFFNFIDFMFKLSDSPAQQIIFVAMSAKRQRHIVEPVFVVSKLFF